MIAKLNDAVGGGDKRRVCPTRITGGQETMPAGCGRFALFALVPLECHSSCHIMKVTNVTALVYYQTSCITGQAQQTRVSDCSTVSHCANLGLVDLKHILRTSM